MTNKNLTGYPSIDKPWLKYHSAEALNSPLPQCTIYEYLYKNNKNHLNDIALNYFDRKITYGQLFENIEKTARAFAVANVKEGDIITICSVTTPEIIYAFYALNRLGAISNMVDPRTSTDGIRNYIDEVNSKIVITIDVALPKIEEAVVGTKAEKIISVSPYNSFPSLKKCLANTVAKFKGTSPEFHENGISWNEFICKSATPEYVQYKKDTCCVIVHTGGTTGMPKGVMLSNDNVNMAAYDCFLCVSGVKRKQIYLNIMPPFIAYGIGNGLHMPLTCGLEVVIVPKFDPNDYAKLINKYKPNHMLGVPSHYKSLLNDPRIKNKDLSYLMTAAVGGDTMRHDLEDETNKWLKEHGCTSIIQKGYGMSEVSAAVSFTVCNDCNKIGCVGVPFPHTVISVFDIETGEELKYGEQGEICMTGPNTMLGYYQNKAETDSVLKVHKDGKVWVHSNDIGYINENGEIFVIGRMKRMIIRPDGHNVWPAVMENIINRHDAVETCAVIGIPNPNGSGGEIPTAFVELQNGVNISKSQVEKELDAMCHKELPERDVPLAYYFVDKIPLTLIGKVDHRKLEEMAQKL